VSVEYAHLDRLWDFDPNRPNCGRIEVTAGSIERCFQLRDDGKPALVFGAHLANWELPALAGPLHGVDSAVLYRMPSVGRIAAAVPDMRTGCMGTLIRTGIGAPSAAAAALDRGALLGMLVAQLFTPGVDVDFFGRRCKANPMIARLARHYDCPIHGTRAVRLPGYRFRMELTEPIVPARDAEGRIDVQGTMQTITAGGGGGGAEPPRAWRSAPRRGAGRVQL